MQEQVEFVVGTSAIVAALGFLAWHRYGVSKVYNDALAALQTVRGSARTQRMHVGGTRRGRLYPAPFEPR